MDREAAARRLNEISTELSRSEAQLGLLVAEEREAHVKVWDAAIAANNSQWVAEKSGQINTVAKSTRIIKLNGRIRALTEERDNIRFMIKYNLEKVL